MILSQERDLLKVVDGFMEFFCEESCGYCTPCRVGNRLLKMGLEKIIEGRGDPEDLPALETLGKTVKLASRCGLGQTSPSPILSTLQNFRSEYERRIRKNPDGHKGTFDIHDALRAGEQIAGRKSVHFGS
jgi:[NiFe] hydrogenase diaphorase moiety large subunit